MCKMYWMQRTSMVSFVCNPQLSKEIGKGYIVFGKF